MIKSTLNQTLFRSWIESTELLIPWNPYVGCEPAVNGTTTRCQDLILPIE